MQHGTEFQNELFEEIVKPGKEKRAPKSRHVARQYRFLFNISYEQFVFLAIALIMIMVLIYSLGVEKGRKLAAVKKPVVPAPAEYGTEPEEKYEETMGKESETIPTHQAEVKKIPKPVRVEAVKGPSKPYTIQVATYWSKPNAKKELDKLKKLGMDPLIISNNGKYELCVGVYADRDDAREIIKKLKKDYKDCFLRRR